MIVNLTFFRPMNETILKQNVKVLSDEFIISSLIDNIRKTDTSLTKISLILVTIMLSYVLVEFEATDNISIGIITLKGNPIIKMVTPILFGFIFLKAHSTYMFLAELKTELREKLKDEYKLPHSKAKLYSAFNLNHYLASINNISGIGLTYLILLILIYLGIAIIPMAFQIYAINNLFLIKFTPKIVLLASQVMSIVLMAVFYGSLFAKIIDIAIDFYGEDENKLDYPKFTLSVLQTITSLIFWIVLVLYSKNVISDSEITVFHEKSFTLFFMTTVAISLFAIINSLHSFKEKIGKGLIAANIIMLMYNLVVLFLFAYVVIFK